MKKYILSLVLLATFGGVQLFAGNPDRQGEAGAYELLMNPWARTAGLSNMTTSIVRGVESMRSNVAGLSRINKTEVVASAANYLDGTDINMYAFGLTQKIGENSAFGLSLMSLDFGDIPVTTVDQPEGTGTTFSPSWFNIGLGYAHTFDKKVSVGILVRGVFESTADISASGFALDAGVQYVTGENDNFKFGIALRNVGGRMKFGGQALTEQLQSGTNESLNDRDFTYTIPVADFELPSLLNIGTSYDIYPTMDHRITVLAHFTANSFSRDQIGGGVEYAFNELFMVRGGYNLEFGETVDDAGNEIQESIYEGLSLGASIEAPFRKGKDSKFGVDYAYRTTTVFEGTHNVSIRISL